MTSAGLELHEKGHHRIPSESDSHYDPELAQPRDSKINNTWMKGELSHDEDGAQSNPDRGLETGSLRPWNRRVWDMLRWFWMIAFVLIFVHNVAQNVLALTAWVTEERHPVSLEAADSPHDVYGSQEPFHHFKGIKLVGQLAPEHLPGGKSDRKRNKRLIFIGDIHGCLKELDLLLRAVHFHPSRDHIVHTGDVIVKGPDPAGVIDRLIQLNATGVRGNWEDRILTSSEFGGVVSSSQNPVPSFEVTSKHDPLRRLKRHHLHYLASLPVILTIPELRLSSASLWTALFPPSTDQDECDGVNEGSRTTNLSTTADLTTSSQRIRLPHLRSPGGLFVVHAGLIPGVPLRRQDPDAVMNMRYVAPDSRVPFSRKPSEEEIRVVRWTKVWGRWQRAVAKRNKQGRGRFAQLVGEALGGKWGGARGVEADREAREKPATVVYGHNAKDGVRVERWSVGLDGGCVRGGRLTAMTLDGKGRRELVSVRCRDYTK